MICSRALVLTRIRVHTAHLMSSLSHVTFRTMIIGVDIKVYMYAALSVIQVYTRNCLIQFSFSFEWDSLIQKRSTYLSHFLDPPAHTPINATDSFRVASLTDVHYDFMHVTLLLFISDSSKPQHMSFRSFCDCHISGPSLPEDVPQQLDPSGTNQNGYGCYECGGARTATCCTWSP